MRRSRCFARGRRSRKKAPRTAAAAGAAASQTIVSAPSAGVRSSGPSGAAEAGSASRIAGVSAQPGVHRVDGDRCSREAPRPAPRPARPARACSGRTPSCRRTRPRWRSSASTSSGSVYIPPEATKITRAGAAASSSGRSARVEQERRQHVGRERRLVSLRRSACTRGVSAPALRTSASTRSCALAKRAASAARLRRAATGRRARPRPSPAAAASSAAGPLGALGVPPDDADGRAAAAPSRAAAAQPETRRCARHDRVLPVERQRLERLPVEEPAAGVVADPGEAADDARLERRVGERGRRSRVQRAARSPAAALSPTRLKSSCISGSRSFLAPSNVEPRVVADSEPAPARLDGDRVAGGEAGSLRLEHDAAGRLELDELVAERDVAAAEPRDEVEPVDSSTRSAC